MKPALLAAAAFGLLLMLAPFALEQLAPSTRSGNPVMTVAEAFAVSHHRSHDELLIDIEMAPGVYLYRHKLSAHSDEVTLGEWSLPAGEPHEDEYFGKSQVYRRSLSLHLPLLHAPAGSRVMLHYQGCATGLCYPPQQLELVLP